jgi:hypothetical protein
VAAETPAYLFWRAGYRLRNLAELPIGGDGRSHEGGRIRFHFYIVLGHPMTGRLIHKGLFLKSLVVKARHQAGELNL